MPNVTDSVTDQKELNDLPVVTELSPTYDLLGIDPGANGSSIITVANFLAQTLKHVTEDGTIHMTDEEQDPGTTVLEVLRDLRESIDNLTTAIQSTGLGGYGNIWTNTVSLKTLNRLRNGGTSLVYADNSNTITGAPAYIKNLSTTFAAYRNEYSASDEDEEPSWGLVELHELVPVKGRTWVVMYDGSTWSSWTSRTEFTTQCGRTASVTTRPGQITDLAVTFDRAFTKTPHVIVGLYSGSNGADMGYVSVSAINVSTTGFTCRFFHAAGSTNRSPNANWAAFGE